MNNLEKNQKELAKYLLSKDAFCVTKDGDICSCPGYFSISCGNCLFDNLPFDDFSDGCVKAREDWLMQEYVEPEVDWSKVPVDTPILVKNFERDLWTRRYFAKYENGKVYAWDGGRTSWSVNRPKEIIDWPIAKLAEE